MRVKNNLEIHTYGDSKAEEILVKIINETEDLRLPRVVSSVLESVTHKLKTIKVMDGNPKTISFVLLAIRDHAFNKIDNSNVLARNLVVISYLKNAVVKRLRMSIKK